MSSRAINNFCRQEKDAVLLAACMALLSLYVMGGWMMTTGHQHLHSAQTIEVPMPLAPSP